MSDELDFSNIKLEVQPHILTVLLSMEVDSSMNFAELERLVRSDVNISAIILKAANSSFYYRGQQIKDLRQAIARLGFNVIRTMAMVAASRQLFESARYSRFRKHVFEHSLASGIIARHFTQKLESECHEEEAFAGGLLHDLGKIVMNQYNRKAYIQVIDLMEKEKVISLEAETEIFGFTHMDAGKWIMKNWRFPVIYDKVLSGHAAPLENDGRSLANIVGYSNILAALYGYGLTSETKLGSLESYETSLDLDEEHRVYFREIYAGDIKEDELFRFYRSFI
jgi:HD-like signal output (HDOD) protein